VGEDGGAVPSSRNQRGDVLRPEAEVRWYGPERGAAIAGCGEPKPPVEAAGNGNHSLGSNHWQTGYFI